MSRSARSGTKNIVEGFKRNTTKEYFDFLGFSIGSIEELKDDSADIAIGVYKGLMGIKGIMGSKGVQREDLDKIRFYPMPKNLDPAVELFLRAKELNYLLYKLQQSLDKKMDNENTKTVSQKVRENQITEKQADKDFDEFLKSQGLVRLENGQVVNKQ
jgi:hypothetical protein